MSLLWLKYPQTVTGAWGSFVVSFVVCNSEILHIFLFVHCYIYLRAMDFQWTDRVAKTAEKKIKKE